MAKADLRVTRKLSTQELGTIRVALELLLLAPAGLRLDELRAVHMVGWPINSDEDVRALIHELAYARKVKVCRSKTPTS